MVFIIADGDYTFKASLALPTKSAGRELGQGYHLAKTSYFRFETDAIAACAAE